MKRGYHLYVTLLLGFVVLTTVPSCGSKSNDDISGPSAATSSSEARTDDFIAVADNLRKCPNNVLYSSISGGEYRKVAPSLLEDFMAIQPQDNISVLEDKTTFCLNISGGKASFDLEFEANRGLYRMSIPSTTPVLVATKSTSSLEVIFMDNQGLIWIKASKSGSRYVGSISYHNFPSYEQAMAEAWAEYEEACDRDGYKDWKVGQCLGITPQPWWQNRAPASVTQLQKAREILGNSSKTTKLGNIIY